MTEARYTARRSSWSGRTSPTTPSSPMIGWPPPPARTPPSRWRWGMCPHGVLPGPAGARTSPSTPRTTPTCVPGHLARAGRQLPRRPVPHRSRPRRLGREGPRYKTVLVDARRTPRCPTARSDSGSESGEGRWNLDLGEIDRDLSLRDRGGRHGRPDPLRDRRDRGRRGDAPRRAGHRVGGRLVTTVFDLLLALPGVGRDGLPGRVAERVRRPSSPYTPAWQEEITGSPAKAAGARVAREFARNTKLHPRPVDDRRWAPAPTTGSTPTRPTARSCRW